MVELDTIAKNLFEKIRARFDDVSVGDEEANATTEPEKARFFNFDYTNAAGDNFGNIMISLIGDHSLKIYFGKNVSADLDEGQKKEWYDFLRDIRMFAKRNLLSFDARDISRNALTPKDLKHIVSSERPETINDTNVTEGREYSRMKKIRHEPIDANTRLRIIYSDSMDEALDGKRGHKTHAIYIEDNQGQRFKTPSISLREARALGRHIASGGQFNDDFSKHILELVSEMASIRQFVGGTRNKTFEDGEADQMVSAAKQRHASISHILHKLAGPRGYHMYKESWTPSVTGDEFDSEPLREKFTQKVFDPRLEAGLPHVHKAYEAMKQQAFDAQMNEFTESLDTIAEGTWALPDNDMAMEELQSLMSDVLQAGIDGSDATNALYNVVGDDELFDRIYDASRGSPEMDVRPIVFNWLKANAPAAYQKVKASMESGGSDNPQQPAPGPEQQESTFSESYYSVESDSNPFYIHSTTVLESAQKHMQKAVKRGQTGVVIYEIGMKEGKKTKNKLQEARATRSTAPVVTKQNTSDLSEIRRLAGLK